MARTLAEIEQVILDAKAAEPELDALNSTSKLAIWRLWVKVVALAHLVFETLLDIRLDEIRAAARSVVAGTDAWYASRMLEFQYGYSLIHERGRLFYLVDDPGSRIIAKVATKTSVGVLLIKVAKDVSGELVKLTDAEKVAVDSYINEIKFAGTNHLLISQDPDLVKLTGMKVYYDGKLILNDVKTAVEQAINDYLRNIFFNGFLNVNAFRDAVELLFGVIGGPDIPMIECKSATGNYVLVTREYNPDSGYFKIDPAFPLSNSAVIEYIAV